LYQYDFCLTWVYFRLVQSISNDWICPSCEHRYQDVSLGEVCPRDGGTLLRFDVYKRHRADPLLGTCIDGRYRLVDVLGKGGFGTVYRCFDSVLSMEFALKTIVNTGTDEPQELRERFLQEGRALAQLSSDHVVEVYETGQDNGVLYMVLELIRGLSLKQHLQREGELNLITSARIVTQILCALEHAHAAGLVHRDLKPSNILFTDLNATHIKVIDFGIAKSINPTSVNGPVTKTGIVIGTVQYMAPEQLRQNLPIGPPVDLYASGILFYQLLMGDTPFVGSQAEIAAGHLYQYPPSLEPKDGVPTGVAQWLQTALAKEPEDRFPNAMTMKVELARAMGTPEENLNTTLPLNNDTIRMTPDISLMHGVDVGHVDNRNAPLKPSTTGVIGSLPNIQLGPHTKGSPGSSEHALSLESVERRKLKDENLSVDDGIQASTQKLTPLTLNDAHQHMHNLATRSGQQRTPKPESAAKGTDLNSLTALADIPVIVFDDEMDKQERSIDESLSSEAEHTSSGSIDAQPGQTRPEIVVPSPELNEVDQTLLKTNPALRIPVLLSRHATQQSLPSTNESPDVSALRASQEVDQSLRETNPMGNAVFQDHKLIEPKPHKAAPHSQHRPSFQQNIKAGAKPSSSLILPYASAWWILPFVLVLSVIIYFIWF
jgi:serine/threonine protein kinase